MNRYENTKTMSTCDADTGMACAVVRIEQPMAALSHVFDRGGAGIF